jgi:hypothetical protein
MKVGDMVKIRFSTFAAMRRAKHLGEPIDEIGFVVSVAENACKVVFPSRGQVRSLLQRNLEDVSELIAVRADANTGR